MLYATVVLAKEKVERLKKKERIGAPQPYPGLVEFSLPPESVADLRKRMDAQSRTHQRYVMPKTEKTRGVRDAAARGRKWRRSNENCVRCYARSRAIR